VGFFTFDFYSLPLSLDARHQLSNTYKSRACWQLADVIRKHAFSPIKASYVPLGKNVYVTGKLPKLSKAVSPECNRQKPFEAVFFTNALLIPEGYHSASFDENTAPAPLNRGTNIGYLIVTHEFDCETREHFEEILGWTRGNAGQSSTRLAEWDRVLSKFKDYRGYCVVFAGARSLHFHFIFSTEHLLHAPFDVTAAERYQGDWQSQSALMHSSESVLRDYIICGSPDFGDRRSPNRFATPGAFLFGSFHASRYPFPSARLLYFLPHVL
jgi:hypothetical protein